MNKQINHTLLYDWFSKSLEHSLHCTLSLSDESFIFSVQTDYSSLSHPESLPRQFKPELWKHDVFELFLASPDGSYIELNLAQNSAWWGAWFSAPRIRSPKSLEANSMATHSSTDNQSYRCSLSFPTSILNHLGDLHSITWNITAITHSPEQRFSTAAKLPGEHPDFHQPAHFLPLF